MLQRSSVGGQPVRLGEAMFQESRIPQADRWTTLDFRTSCSSGKVLTSSLLETTSLSFLRDLRASPSPPGMLPRPTQKHEERRTVNGERFIENPSGNSECNH